MTNWIKRYLELATHVATWSKDPSCQVGAVIVTADNKPVSFGFNGFPRGFDDDPSRYENKEYKLRHVIHAELNAILNAERSVAGCTIYVTHPPCQQCAGAIVQAGIISVHAYHPGPRFFMKWNVPDTKQIFEETNTHFKLYNRE